VIKYKTGKYIHTTPYIILVCDTVVRPYAYKQQGVHPPKAMTQPVSLSLSFTTTRSPLLLLSFLTGSRGITPGKILYALIFN